MHQPDISCYQGKAPVAEMGYILLSHWPKGSHSHPNVTGYCQCFWLSPQPDGKILLLQVPSTNPIKPSKIRAGAQREDSPLLFSIYSAGRYYTHYRRRKIIITLTQQ